MIVADIVAGGIVAGPGGAVAATIVTDVVTGQIIGRLHHGGGRRSAIVAGVVTGRVVGRRRGRAGGPLHDRNGVRGGRDLVGSGDGEAAQGADDAGDGECGEEASTHEVSSGLAWLQRAGRPVGDPSDLGATTIDHWWLPGAPSHHDPTPAPSRNPPAPSEQP